MLPFLLNQGLLLQLAVQRKAKNALKFNWYQIPGAIRDLHNFHKRILFLFDSLGIVNQAVFIQQ